jgi:5-oxoprolinase (ATP-hydrolysing)
MTNRPGIDVGSDASMGHHRPVTLQPGRPSTPDSDADQGRWEFWIDRGGTFTDVVARGPAGELRVEKVLSEARGRRTDSVIEGVRRVLGVAPDGRLPVERIASVKVGTTVATNALLERTGERTVLVITRGFADALRIGYQNRPRIFARRIVLPEMLYERVVEVDERVAADGSVLIALEEAAVAADLERVRGEGVRSVAVVLLHGYRHPDHEQAVARIARELGFAQVSVSHRVSPLIKLVSRGDTTVVDAYLSPLLDRYVGRLADQLPGVDLRFMQSNGGLTDARHFRGRNAILSGPAGGVVGMVRSSEKAGHRRVVGFDMGGTSTDVSHYAGELERDLETEVAGVRMRTPMMSIHTVAAGGGSVLRFDGTRYRIGPDSAGADPGPACYRMGGPLAVTDANVLLGRIQPDHFPRVFGPTSDQPIAVDIVRSAFTGLAGEIAGATGQAPEPEEVAAGFRAVAVANMANAIKKISVERGYDVSEYALATFGGAGGQHACSVADALGIRTVLVDRLAGVLSAYGIGQADALAMRERSVEEQLTDRLLPVLDAVFAELDADARAQLRAEGVPEDRISATEKVLLKYDGTDTSLAVPRGPVGPMVEEFEQTYRRRFAFLMPDRRLVVAAVSVELIGATAGHRDVAVPAPGTGDTTAVVPMFVDGAWRDVDLFRRDDLRPGQRVPGPALVVDGNSTTVVEQGWRAEVQDEGQLVLTRERSDTAAETASTSVDPVRLEIFNNLFMAIAEQMGARLQSTAHSVNIKERLDFSCAVFDAQGRLIANAPHIPVHLGSMGDSVLAVIEQNAGSIRRGDVFALNNPYRGGTHLPDITVVTPMFDPSGTDVWFYVASRGHHADIGGMTPGSMPPFSTRVEEEGVVIDNWRLVEAGRFRDRATAEMLTGVEFPARNPRANLADLRAQVAANEKGAAELLAMVSHFGLDVVHAYMDHVRANAAEAVRRVIGRLRDGSFDYELDSGARIKVAIRVDRERRTARLDFAGTTAQLPGNFNAPSSVVRAAVLYVFRTLVEDEIPLNAGCLEPLEIVIPEGSMLAPTYPAAVVAGNVETSQAITGALYGALGAQAEGSGTMNNLTFGNDRHQYYETLASGSGAGDGYDGTDVVQTHMTNSRLTDPEVLEWRFPVLVEEHRIRPRSGGGGRWPGGNGAVRRIRFTEPMSVSLLSGHRRVPPYGVAGGQPGELGRQWVERADGTRTELGGCDSTDVGVGDVVVVETPGGGGYGMPEDQ